jgi:CHASE1-domain containing sensor protein
MKKIKMLFLFTLLIFGALFSVIGWQFASVNRQAQSRTQPRRPPPLPPISLALAK